jgi:hypothetical protein
MKNGVIVVTMFLLMIGTGVLAQAGDDWSIPMQVTLNGSPLTPFPLEFGMKTGTTDHFDGNIDVVAPLSTPDGDDAYFQNLAGEDSPYDKLLKDFRANTGALTNWVLVLKIAPGKVVKVDWSNLTLPKGKITSWQEADNKGNGQGLIRYFSDNPRQIELKNAGGEVMVKRFLIRSN